MDEDKSKDEEPKPDEPLSIVGEARAIRNEILKAKEELKAENERNEKLQTENLLASTAGAGIPIKELSEAEEKKAKAAEFFKGTALEDAIKKS